MITLVWFYNTQSECALLNFFGSFKHLHSQCFVLPTAPRVAPTTFQGINSSSTSISLQWSNISAMDVAGVLRNFHIAYRELDTADNTTHTVTVPLANLTFELTDLRKYTNYSIEIMGVTKFVGIGTEPIIVSTDEDSKFKLFLLIP